MRFERADNTFVDIIILWLSNKDDLLAEGFLENASKDDIRNVFFNHFYNNIVLKIIHNNEDIGFVIIERFQKGCGFHMFIAQEFRKPFLAFSVLKNIIYYCKREFNAQYIFTLAKGKNKEYLERLQFNPSIDYKGFTLFEGANLCL